jgi:hypothetical protein
MAAVSALTPSENIKKHLTETELKALKSSHFGQPPPNQASPKTH